MSYRTITVDGVDHQYSIGKKFLKFRSGSLVPVKDIGYPINPILEQYMITPATIAEYLRTGKVEIPTQCRCTKTDYTSEDHRGIPCTNPVSSMRAWPFQAEIEGKLHYQFMCDECYNRNADDI